MKKILEGLVGATVIITGGGDAITILHYKSWIPAVTLKQQRTILSVGSDVLTVRSDNNGLMADTHYNINYIQSITIYD